jgi:hypothetical protein
MVKVKYIGLAPGHTDYVGLMQPGEIREVNKRVAEILVRGQFEIVEEKKQIKIKKGV